MKNGALDAGPRATSTRPAPRERLFRQALDAELERLRAFLDLGVASLVRAKPQLPAEVEDHRDQHWCREGTRQIETALDAERFIEQIGFAACLTDSRRPGPSLYVAVCGRRDAVMPRNVQKDEEASLTWVLKDEIVGRGKVYYAKLARGKTMFLAPRMIPYFHAVWGMRKSEEKRRLSRNAQAILKVLRREWEMSTADLRDESGVKDRSAFTKAARRTAGRHDRRAERGLLSAEVHLHLDARRRPLSRRAAPARQSRHRGARNRPLLSGRRRHDDSRRDGPRDGTVAARSRTRQPRARGRRLRDDAVRRERII